jgi:hypothetical protein
MKSLGVLVDDGKVRCRVEEMSEGLMRLLWQATLMKVEKRVSTRWLAECGIREGTKIAHQVDEVT